MSDATLVGIADRAFEYVRSGDVLGLGTGRAATAFVAALGRRVAEGLAVRGVPTSETTPSPSRAAHPLVGLEQVDQIDVTSTGADEVDDRLDMIKGYGGALVREKIVAATSRRRVMLVGAEKLVRRVGERGRLPVEVVPFALPLASRRLAALGRQPCLREVAGKPVVTDNGNRILDLGIQALADPSAMELEIRSIPGVVGTGLFLGMADIVLVQDGSEVKVLERSSAMSKRHEGA
jgi:ribose 5-phosphate isomerase A